MEIFKQLSYPKQWIRTIKLKRYLKERGFNEEFTDIDIFLAQKSKTSQVGF